jgi:hypothetical protein
MQRESLRRELPPPDEDSARQHCLRKGVDAPDLATVKDFLRFHVSISRGYIDEDEKPTVDSVNTHAEWFFAGFTRVTGTPTDEEDRSEVYEVGGLPLGRGESNLTIPSGSGPRSLRRVSW